MTIDIPSKYLFSGNIGYATGAAVIIALLCILSTQVMLVKALAAPKFCREKNVLLTGATGGLGRAIAVQLSQNGVRNLILTGRDMESLASIASECTQGRTETIHVHTVKCDLADLSAVDKLSSDALNICDVDIFVHCGGISSRSSFLETDISVDQTLMNVNFLSGALIAKRVIPGMVKRKAGKVIWISSVQGLIGTPFRSSYAASKFAVQGYCEALRGELAGDGVLVHCVSPGYIKTNLSLSALKGDGKVHGKMDPTTLSGADPVDVAKNILRLVDQGKTDFIVAAGISAKVAIALKFFAPKILEKLLVKRFQKASKERH